MGLKVFYMDGLGMIVGDLGEPGVRVWLMDPWGNPFDTVSGSKPAWGAGGFEFLAPHAGEEYQIGRGDDPQGDPLDHEGRVTVVAWVDEPDPEPPDPEPPDPEPPDPEPEPPPAPGWIKVLPGRRYSGYVVGDRVDWVAGYKPGANQYHVGVYLPGTTQYLPTSQDALEAISTWLEDLDERLERLKRSIGSWEESRE